MTSHTRTIMTPAAATPGTQTPTRPHHSWTRRLVTLLLTVVAGTVFALQSLSPAQAQIIVSDGIYGTVGSAPTTCSYLNYTSSLRTTTGAPTVYAFDRSAGAGNDAQFVRYRVVWYYGSGQVRSASDWSGVTFALDNLPAAWSGSTTQSWRYDDQVSTGVQVEFYNVDTFAYEGTVTDWTPNYDNFQEDNYTGWPCPRPVDTL